MLKKNNIHSFGKYKKYVKDMKIYEDKNMRDYHFSNGIDTLIIKANMGMGKTKKLQNIFNEHKDKKIVIVSFRRTLDKEYVNNFEGFMLYEDITMKTYDTDIYDKMVIQIDSFHKIRGEVDILILDEFVYTSTHLIEKAKHKEAVYNTLLQYIRNLNIKIIVMDALLDIYTVKWFYHQRRKIQYIENVYKKHVNIKINNYENRIGIFIDDIYSSLSKNKKIIIPTNSKNFLSTLEKNIKNKLPNLKCKFLNADNSDDINLENWNDYDIVGYTPTIVAGISYEDIHFDKVFAYFVNSSSCAEMSLQQLFRVRNLNDNEINLCIENKDNNKYLTSIKDIEEYIIDRNTCLIDGVMGVKISNIYRNILKDSYFYLYLDCQIRNFKSKNNYEEILISLLKSQGIDNIKRIDRVDLDLDKLTRKDMMENSKIQKDDIIKDIINADEIDDENYYLMKNKINKTYNEKNIIKKKSFRNTFGYLGEISFEMYKKYNNKTQQYKNINTIYTFKDKLLNYLQHNIENIENVKQNKYNDYIEENENLYGNVLLSPNPFILHQSKKNEKFLMGLDLMNNLGITNLLKKEAFDIDFKKILDYIKLNEYKIRLLFRCKEFSSTINVTDTKEILKYINARLRTLFYIQIKKNKKNEYIVDNLDYWSDEINPFKVNENLINDYDIELMIKNINIDS